MKTNNLLEGLQAFLIQNPEIKIEEEEVVDDKPTKNNFKSSCLHVQVEKKGRAGKIATFIDGFEDWDSTEIELLASELKKSLATGGSFREKEILIQGNRVVEVKNFLRNKGYKVK